ncbi:Ig-like domain-containing protein [Streptomyces sp. NPDC001339]|uniref:L,D-transpeptidase n=1 Tax=Streptomyces sp. NPDC001339 TaxID=3364563 RepID=UPI0036A9AE87
MTDSKRRKDRIAAVALLGSVLALAASGTGYAAAKGSAGDDGGAGGTRHENTRQVDEAVAKDAKDATGTSDAKITIAPKGGATNVGVDRATKVTVSEGRLTDVTMTAVATGQKVRGTLSADGTSWTPDRALRYMTTYELTAHAVDSQEREAVENSRFTTATPPYLFLGNFTPEDGSTVGVGMPVSINFDKPVKNKAAVESAIKVSASSNQRVVGHWFSDTRLDFRPRGYWQANSEVTMALGLDGVQASPGVTGMQNKTVRFHIGHAQVSTVDVKTHRMTVMRDGEVVKTIPISAGGTENPTYNGKMVISERFQQTRMDGSTVGFKKKNGKGEYDIPDVPHAQRLSASGTFIHGNYWSKGVFGHANTSHGCIGLKDVKGADDPTTDGAWFFDHSQTGDVVEVINSPDRTVKPDNGLNGWNMDWSQWVAGSALR